VADGGRRGDAADDRPAADVRVAEARAGTYTINTIPGDEWTLLVGRPAEPTEKRPKQWGIPYQPDLEIGKVPMTVSKTPTTVEQLTIVIEDTPGPGGTLRIEWGSTRAEAPFTIG
jgi:hypothetical protein